MDNKRTRKGQAAMEYLMTYGWAILVIVIVLAILAFFLPQLVRTPESCIFSQPGFSCQEKKPVIVADANNNNVGITFQLNNQQGQEVNVRYIICTTAAPGDITLSMVEGEAIDERGRVPAGGSQLFGVLGTGGEGHRIPCFTPEGQNVILRPNSDFKGYLAIWYNYANEVPDAPLRKATAVLSGMVLEETGSS